MRHLLEIPDWLIARLRELTHTTFIESYIWKNSNLSREFSWNETGRKSRGWGKSHGCLGKSFDWRRER